MELNLQNLQLVSEVPKDLFRKADQDHSLVYCTPSLSCWIDAAGDYK